MVSISKNQLHEIVKHEEDHWSRIFLNEKDQVKKRLFSSYWWEDYYSQICIYMNGILTDNGARIIELGSGSGKATLLLHKNYKKELFDISHNALAFAKELNKRIQSPYVQYVQGNAFANKLPSSSYDLVWNIGVLEHYDLTNAQTYCDEMVRLTKRNGYMAVAIPNFASLQIKKARLLRASFLHWVPGYRLDNEIEYSASELQSIIVKSARAQGREIVTVEIMRFGNPLLMETPKWVLKTFGMVIDRAFSSKRFLVMVTVKIS